MFWDNEDALSVSLIDKVRAKPLNASKKFMAYCWLHNFLVNFGYGFIETEGNADAVDVAASVDIPEEDDEYT